MPEVGNVSLNDEYGAIVRRLIKRRHLLGLAQEEVDARIGCTTGQVGKWEVGKYRAGYYNIVCWAQALGLRFMLVPTEEQPHAEPILEEAYRDWLVTVGRLNTPEARSAFNRYLGIE